MAPLSSGEIVLYFKLIVISILVFSIRSCTTVTSGGMAPLTVEKVDDNSMFVNKLPEEINEMKKEEKGMEATVVEGNDTETGHVIVTTIGGRNGQPKDVTIRLAC